MIAVHVDREPLAPETARRFFAFAGETSGRTPTLFHSGHVALAQLSTSARHQTVVPDGRWQVLLEGQIHNRSELAERFGPGGDDALYAAALDRWGDEADQHVVGHYCAIALDRGGHRLRLARSPFAAPPLHYRRDEQGITASSLLRCVNWRVEGRAEPDLVMLAQRMLGDFSATGRDWYRDGHRVPQGCAIEVDFGGLREVWRYDIFACPRLPETDPQACVEQALALFDEGVARALDGVRLPGVLVSGGLDSAQVAASAALQLGPERTVHGFTYGPEAIPPDSLVPGQFADDRVAVSGLAALHPGLRLHTFANAGQDFRHGQHDLVRAMGCAPPSLGLSWQCHDIYQRARELGCDAILTGEFGNESFSNTAPWGFAEYLRRGRWRELLLALRGNRGDSRPLWRRFLSLAVLPNLPAPLRRSIRQALHGPDGDPLAITGIAPQWAAETGVLEAAHGRGFDPQHPPVTSHDEAWRRLMAEDGQDIAESSQGFELLYGLPTRDPTAYRPLVEFCFGLPTAMFLRGGIDRWLAREMAKGRLPEEQRLRREQGAHELDWHLRIGRARPALLEEIARMEDDPDIARVVDLAYLRHILEHFPERSTWRNEVRAPYVTALNRGISAGRFIAYAKGRNDI